MSSTLGLGLLALFLISFLGNGPIPLPLTATLMWLGQFQMPWLIIGVSTLGTLLGWLAMEGVLRRWLIRNPRVMQSIPHAYREFFLKRTGLWLFLFNALPLPFDFMRFLALLNHYNRWRLLIILTAARLVRNALLVLLGASLAQHPILFWAVLLGLLVMPLLAQRLMPQAVESAVE